MPGPSNVPARAAWRPGRPSAIDGRIIDGRIIDGRIIDGRIIDGRIIDGRIIDGRIIDGDFFDLPSGTASNRATGVTLTIENRPAAAGH
jgi:hypothetical protein